MVSLKTVVIICALIFCVSADEYEDEYEVDENENSDYMNPYNETNRDEDSQPPTSDSYVPSWNGVATPLPEPEEERKREEEDQREKELIDFYRNEEQEVNEEERRRMEAEQEEIQRGRNPEIEERNPQEEDEKKSAEEELPYPYWSKSQVGFEDQRRIKEEKDRRMREEQRRKEEEKREELDERYRIEEEERIKEEQKRIEEEEQKRIEEEERARELEIEERNRIENEERNKMIEEQKRRDEAIQKQLEDEEKRIAEEEQNQDGRENSLNEVTTPLPENSADIEDPNRNDHSEPRTGYDYNAFQWAEPGMPSVDPWFEPQDNGFEEERERIEQERKRILEEEERRMMEAERKKIMEEEELKRMREEQKRFEEEELRRLQEEQERNRIAEEQKRAEEEEERRRTEEEEEERRKTEEEEARKRAEEEEGRRRTEEEERRRPEEEEPVRPTYYYNLNSWNQPSNPTPERRPNTPPSSPPRWDPRGRGQDPRGNNENRWNIITTPPPHHRQPFIPSYYNNNNENIVSMPNGASVRGKLSQTAWTGKNFKSFLGIKYGIVGSGIARFQPAQPVRTNNAVIDATVEPNGCPSFPDLYKIQKAEQQGINVEDCLTLSVFTPDVYNSHPVMIYVHGEMLFDGSAEEAKPDYLLEKNVVLVTVNYRLAPFGFLSLQNDLIPGNIALSDLEMAIKWVEENIAAFGGNPNSVTLFGQAGGATLIHALSLNDKLNSAHINRIILQSGTALSPLFIDDNPLATAEAIGKEARCPYAAIYSQYELSQCLGHLNTSALLSAFLEHCSHNEYRGIHSYSGFKLSVGDKLGYMPMHPALMVNNFKYPLLAGMAKDAGAFILTRNYDELMRLNSKSIVDYINVVLKHTTVPKYYTKWTRVAMEKIFTPEDISMPDLNNIASGLLELTNLILYKEPLLESIKSSWKTQPTFLYSFDHRGQFHRFDKKQSGYPYEIDVSLSDDNIYLFPYPAEVSNLNPEDRAVADLMTNMWTKFASTERPDNSWPQVSNDYGPFVRITGSLEIDFHFGEGIEVPDLYQPLRESNSNNNGRTRY